MKFRLTCLAMAVAAAVAFVSAEQNDAARTLMEAARKKEVVDGDLKGAIQQYQTIAEKYKSDHAVAADALVRLAACYEKLGDAEARKIYERIARDYSDQEHAAGIARERLTLQSPTPLRAGQTARLVWAGQDAFGSVRGSPSPDGRYLTFLQTGTGALAVRDLKEGSTRILAREAGASMFYSAFSPDARQVAYAWTTQVGKQIKADLRVASMTGSDITPPQIVHSNEEMTQIRPFGWTPDGKYVLVLRSLKGGSNQIGMVSIRDGAIRVLKTLPWSYTTMSLSPDGRYIAYEALSGNNTAPSEIFVLSTDGLQETRVVQGPAVNGSPMWAPDGAQLLFLSDRTGNTSLWAVPIHQGKPNAPAELLKADIGRVRLQGITRNGALYYLVAGVLRSNIYTAALDATMNATTTPAVATDRFLNSNSASTWSPNGRYLAYLSSRGRSTVLAIRTLATGEERDIPLPKEVQTGNLVPAPRWFPDGGSLLVLGYLPKGAGVFYRVDVTSGKADVIREAQGVSGNGGLGASVISPDGRSIFYIASASDPFAGQTNLIRFEIDSSHETVLGSGAGNSLALSPDGTQLALLSYDGTPGGCHLEVMPAGGGETRDVVRTADCAPSRVTWSPHNELLFVRGSNRTANVLWRVPATGGQPEQMGISMPGQLDNPHVHPDGRRITFTVFETGASEVWTLEHFLPAVKGTR